MIARITGRLVDVSDAGVAIVERDGVAYEVFVPAASQPELAARCGQELTLFTVLYLEGNLAAGNLVPRLLGFVSAVDRAFFHEFTKVRGISQRRGMRAMSLPTAQLATAIEHGDERLLATLPEIGKKTAAQIVADLRGKLAAFVTGAGGGAAPGLSDLTDAQRVALEILVQWGDRRHDAQRWITAAVDEEPGLHDPEEIVRAAYRVKNRR